MADNEQEPKNNPSIHLNWGNSSETKEVIWSELDAPTLRVFWDMGFEDAGDEIFERTGKHPSWNLSNMDAEKMEKVMAWYARHPEEAQKAKEIRESVNDKYEEN